MVKFTLKDLQPGQRFLQTEGDVWRIEDIIRFPHEPVVHVRMIKERDGISAKTVSGAALLDRNLFRRME